MSSQKQSQSPLNEDKNTLKQKCIVNKKISLEMSSSPISNISEAQLEKQRRKSSEQLQAQQNENPRSNNLQNPVQDQTSNNLIIKEKVNLKQSSLSPQNVTEQNQQIAPRTQYKQKECNNKMFSINVLEAQKDQDPCKILAKSTEILPGFLKGIQRFNSNEKIPLNETIISESNSLTKIPQIQYFQTAKSQISKEKDSLLSRQMNDTKGNTKVIARFRPMNEMEKQLQSELNFKIDFPFPNSVDIIVDSFPQSFTLDKIFPMQSEQQEIFDYVGAQTMEDILQGYNGTIFAYGQTGTGKTYTMMGTDIYDKKAQGIIPQAVSYIFEYISKTEMEIEFTLKCSMLEIYKEQLRDLIQPDLVELKIKDSPDRGIYVEGLSELCVISIEEMLNIINHGNDNRIVASTGMNKQSSRSHSLFILEVHQKLPNSSERKGILNLVDLAGSEKISKSKVKGENLEEAKKINLSLSALGNVIHALTSNQDHIPYRDSKLTRLLQQSLGGHFKTSLIVCCSPHPHNFEETISTLKFACRAKQIKNKPRRNIKRSPSYYIKIINELKKELEELKLKLPYQVTENISPFSVQLKNSENPSQFKETLSFSNLFSPLSAQNQFQSSKSALILNQLVEPGSVPQSSQIEYQRSLNYEEFQYSPSGQQKEMQEMQISSLKNECQSLHSEIYDLKQQNLALENKLEKINIQLLESQDKVIEIQAKYQKATIDYHSLQEQNTLIQQNERNLKKQIQFITRYINEQDCEIQKLIAEKVQKCGSLNEIELSFVEKYEEQTKYLIDNLKRNMTSFSLDIQQFIEINEENTYSKLISDNIEEDTKMSIEYLLYKHRCEMNKAYFFNTQLIHVLYALH